MPVGIFGIIMSKMIRPMLIKHDLQRIAAAPVGAKRHKVIRLQGRWHVEVLSRCVREKRDPVTGSFDQDSLDLAEQVLSVSLQHTGNVHSCCCMRGLLYPP